MVNFHNKVFQCKSIDNHRDVTNATMFFYKQNGSIVQAKYYGGKVTYGELIGLVNNQGILHVSFNHSNHDSQFVGGVGTFTLETGKGKPWILYGKWTWADGSNCEEKLIMEEINEIVFHAS